MVDQVLDRIEIDRMRRVFAWCVRGRPPGERPSPGDLQAVMALIANEIEEQPLIDLGLFRLEKMRQLWSVHYPGLARCTASVLIEGEWASWAKRRRDKPRRHDPLPGSKEEIFEQLRSAGLRPVKWGVIAYDLDFTQDRHRVRRRSRKRRVD